MNPARNNPHGESPFSRLSGVVGSGPMRAGREETLWTEANAGDMMAALLHPDVFRAGVPTDLLAQNRCVHRPLKTNFEPVLAVVDAYMSSPDAKYDSETVYQLLRSSGAIYKEAAAPSAAVEIIGREIQNTCVLRMQDFYVPLTILGEKFFPIKPLFTQQGAVLKLNADYIMVGSLNTPKCLGVSTGTYGQTIQIEVAVEARPTRRSTKILEYSAPAATFNKDYSEFRTGHVTKLETLVSSLGFRRGTENATNTKSELRNLRQAVKVITGSSQLCRYVRAYATLLALDHTKTEKIRLRNPCRYQVVEYTLDNLETICAGLMSGGGTVLNCCGMTANQIQSAMTMVLPFPCVEIPCGRRFINFGGFRIQAETNKMVYIFVDNADMVKAGDSLSLDEVEISADGIYHALLAHATLLHATRELVDAVSIAACLFMSNDLPTFSLPASQGFLDIVAPAILPGLTGVFVPPRYVTDYLLFGALAVTRQMMLMLQDICSHGDPASVGNVASHFSGNRQLRMKIYSHFAELRFSDAFSIVSIVDPLNITENASWKRILSLPYIDFAWSSLKKGQSLKNSMSAFFDSGLWEDVDKIRGLSREDAVKARSTLYVNGLLGEVRVKGALVSDKNPPISPRYTNLSPYLRSGQVSTLHYSFYANTQSPDDVDRTGFEEIAAPKLTQLEDLEEPSPWLYPEWDDDSVEDEEDEPVEEEEPYEPMLIPQETLIETPVVEEVIVRAPSPVKVAPKPKRIRPAKGVLVKSNKTDVGFTAYPELSWRKKKTTVFVPPVKAPRSIPFLSAKQVAKRMNEIMADSSCSRTTLLSDLLTDAVTTDPNGAFCWVFHMITGTSLAPAGVMEWAVICKATMDDIKAVELMQMVCSTPDKSIFVNMLQTIASHGVLPTGICLDAVPTHPPEADIVIERMDENYLKGSKAYRPTLMNQNKDRVTLASLPQSNDPEVLRVFKQVVSCGWAVSIPRMLNIQDLVSSSENDTLIQWYKTVLSDNIPSSSVDLRGRLVRFAEPVWSQYADCVEVMSKLD